MNIQTKKNFKSNDLIKSSSKIKIENDSIIGSMSLEGGLIDDISFKKHKQNLENNLNVNFFNPAQTEMMDFTR